MPGAEGRRFLKTKAAANLARLSSTRTGGHRAWARRVSEFAAWPATPPLEPRPTIS